MVQSRYMELETGVEEREPQRRYKQFTNLVERCPDFVEAELFTLVPVAEVVKGYHSYHPAHKDNVFDHSVKVCAGIDNPIGRIAGLMHDWGKVIGEVQEPNSDPNASESEAVVYKHPDHHVHGAELARDALRDLGAPEEDIQLVHKLIWFHDDWGHKALTDEKASIIRDAFNDEELDILFELQLADLDAHAPDYADRRQMELLHSQDKIRKAPPAPSRY